jgi:hypothetical protein
MLSADPVGVDAEAGAPGRLQVGDDPPKSPPQFSEPCERITTRSKRLVRADSGGMIGSQRVQSVEASASGASASALPEPGSMREPKLREDKHRSHRQDHNGEQCQSPTTHPMQIGAGKSHND